MAVPPPELLNSVVVELESSPEELKPSEGSAELKRLQSWGAHGFREPWKKNHREFPSQTVLCFRLCNIELFGVVWLFWLLSWYVVVLLILLVLLVVVIVVLVFVVLVIVVLVLVLVVLVLVVLVVLVLLILLVLVIVVDVAVALVMIWGCSVFSL